MVNTHSPTSFQFTPLREGRRKLSAALSQTKTFQFTPLREGRRKVCVIGSVSVRFQFTPLREGRRNQNAAGAGGRYFNSRPSARGDTNTYGAISYYVIFQFTPLREGRRNNSRLRISMKRFQFTPLREGRRNGSFNRNWKFYFNSRPSARGDAFVWLALSQEYLFQFTPLREGRQDSRCVLADRRRISIHAPPRGATTSGSQGRRGRCYFNSRPSARGDERDVSEDGRIDISIHAPPRGATAAGTGKGNTTLFQFTPLREGRHCHIISAGDKFLFQFTPLREGRRFDCGYIGELGKFQFTPLREGRLDSGFADVKFVTISIHAPPRGATVWDDTNIVNRIFQFTPLREGRPIGLYSAVSVSISIHAPPRGATAVHGANERTDSFQFTPLREGRHKRCWQCRKRCRFQFTPLREGRRNRVAALTSDCEFQFTPLREGRHICQRLSIVQAQISIHAPPRGATVKQGSRGNLHHFNSRPSARGDQRLRTKQLHCKKFQFTPLREGRRANGCSQSATMGISIHAPPRGATIREWESRLATLFQFTPLREGRHHARM